MFKFKSAVLLKLQRLWLDTLVFFFNAFGRRSQSDTVYSVNLRTCAHALRMHYAPKLRTLNVLQIANYKMGN